MTKGLDTGAPLTAAFSLFVIVVPRTMNASKCHLILGASLMGPVDPTMLNRDIYKFHYVMEVDLVNQK